MIQKALVVILWKSEALSTERKILLLKVTPERGAFWQSVTGKVDEGETFLDAALREAQEETGFRFERIPQYLGLDYTFEGRWGPVHEKAFFLPVIGGSTPPTPTLDPKEHNAFQWVTPAEAIALVPHPGNKEAIERATQETPPLFLRRGVFYQEGEEITHTRTSELLHKSLVREKNGAFKVRMNSEELDVILEDTPLFVLSYDRSTGMNTYSNGEKALLKPETLKVRTDNSLVCDKEKDWPALYLSSAYYEITKDIKSGSLDGEYVLHFLGRDHLLRVSK